MPTLNPLSILDSVKKALGIDFADTSFDVDVIMHINAVFGSLQQLGAGPREGFFIEDNTALWSNFTQAKSVLGLVKSYIYLQVRLMFDPPQVGFVINAMREQSTMLEWRIVTAAEDLDPPVAPVINRAIEGFDRYRLLADVTQLQIESAAGVIGVSSEDFMTQVDMSRIAYWWNLAGHADFPAEAEPGDAGFDLITGQMWVKDIRLPDSAYYWWDITGGDFPADALVGDMGIDKDTGIVWRKQS